MKDLTVLMAAFDERQLAENQWGALVAMIHDGEIDVDDAAVVANIDNEIGVVHDLHHPVRRGALIGSLLVVLGPAGLVVGAAAGALAGKAADIMSNGLSKGTLEELGRFLGTNQYMIVVSGEDAVVRALGDTFTESSRRIVHLVAADGDGIRAEIATTG